MHDIDALVRGRRSVRTFDGRNIQTEHLAQLESFMEKVANPYGLSVNFKLLSAKVHALRCPVVVGTDLYVGGKMQKAPCMNEAFGYSFEKLLLFAQSLGIGTVWVGGTMDRAGFENAMELADDEMMPCVSPLGYAAAKMSLRETLMRKGINADGRAAFEELFFDGTFSKPFTKQKVGPISHALEMVRLAPSAVNRQPWRVVVADQAAHFYLKRSKGFGGGMLDMQKIDMGIALCHFELAALEDGLHPRFSQNNPHIAAENGVEYIASYHFE